MHINSILSTILFAHNITGILICTVILKCFVFPQMIYYGNKKCLQTGCGNWECKSRTQRNSYNMVFMTVIVVPSATWKRLSDPITYTASLLFSVDIKARSQHEGHLLCLMASFDVSFLFFSLSRSPSPVPPPVFLFIISLSPWCLLRKLALVLIWSCNLIFLVWCQRPSG